jgi:hypothetical protein
MGTELWYFLVCTNICNISLDLICKVKPNCIVDDKLLVAPVKLQAVFVKQISFNICLLCAEIFLAISKHDNETKLLNLMFSILKCLVK